jgi:hypothetical protein
MIMGSAMEMPRYQSHKKVWALKIKKVDVGGLHSRMFFEENGYAPTTVETAMFARYTPIRGDYYVVYDDGYKSISPAKAFEEGYTLVEKS